MGTPGGPTRDRSDGSWLRVARRPFEATSVAPAWVGLWIAVALVVLHAAYDVVFLAARGVRPFWESDLWWTQLVNAALIGYLAAAQAIARRGVARDLA